VGQFWQHDDTIGLSGGGFHGGNVFRCCLSSALDPATGQELRNKSLR
jgi:hypothetical protein